MGMDPLEALVKSSRKSPDKLYSKAFLYFQALLRPLKSGASKVQLPSHLPESVYSDRTILGLVITAALIAMLDHRAKTGGATVAPPALLVNIKIMPLEARQYLDDIILDQAATIGAGIFASEVAHSRILEWEHHDYGKFKHCLRALDKAARVHQRMMPTPLTDPFRRKVKQRALTELRPALKRLQEEFKARRERPTKNETLEAFVREASNPRLSFLSNSHNLRLWIEFLQIDPLSLLTTSAADLFDNFAAFITSHKPDYTRRKFSSKS
jgi:hypothetical protein